MYICSPFQWESEKWIAERLEGSAENINFDFNNTKSNFDVLSPTVAINQKLIFYFK